MKKLQLPFGVNEYKPCECYNKTVIESKIGQVFELNGYERISTSTLEYYELFDNIVDKNSVNRMFKMTDSDGSLLVLRPDTTVQACRMAASSVEAQEITRFYYMESCFEYIPETGSARTRQFSQIGLELFGRCGVDGDAEVVILAVEALINAGLKDFLIEIGHLDFFQGLILESGLSDLQIKQLKAYINNKDSLGLEMMFTDLNVDSSVKDVLLSLPTLFGREKVLNKAETLCLNPVSIKALNDLRRIISAVKAYGYEQYISIDLGMLKSGYYTGTVFRGIVSGQGLPILEGGRYDSLCSKFNSDMGAVGFAVGVDRVLKALELQGKRLKKPSADIAYLVYGDITKTIVEKIRKFRESGKRVIRLFGGSDDSALKYCADNGIGRLLIFEDGSLKAERTVTL